MTPISPQVRALLERRQMWLTRPAHAALTAWRAEHAVWVLSYGEPFGVILSMCDAQSSKGATQ